MNLVEAWGSGIPKLMQAMQEYGLREPEFIDMEVAFRINLYRGQNEVIEVKNRDHDLNHGQMISIVSSMISIMSLLTSIEIPMTPIMIPKMTLKFNCQK